MKGLSYLSDKINHGRRKEGENISKITSQIKLIKNINLWVQDSQQSSYRKNTKGSQPRLIVIQL